MREEKQAARKDSAQSRLDRVFGSASSSNSGTGSARDKYLDKINQLKAKAKNRPAEPVAALGGLDAIAENHELTSKGLSTWLVNDGANELLVRTIARLPLL